MSFPPIVVPPRLYRTAVLTGVAAPAAAVVGFAAQDAHSLKVQMPDGSFAGMDYVGDAASTVRFVTGIPVMPSAFFELFDETSLPMFNQVSPEMDRQADAMLRQAQTPQAAPQVGTGGLGTTALGALPYGTVKYQSVTTGDGMRTCERRIATSFEADLRPHVVSRVSDDCKKMDRTVALELVDAVGSGRQPSHEAAKFVTVEYDGRVEIVIHVIPGGF